MTPALRIGLVTEGPTDQIVLEKLISAYCSTMLNEHPGVAFVPLQPNGDRTSEGGWEQVYKLCLNNLPEARRGTYFGGGLFADDLDALQCDVILVHLDSDICHQFRDKSPIVPVPSSTSPPAERGDFVRRTILAWLWPSGSVADDKHIAAPAVEATETWLVAGLCDDSDVECLTTPAVLRRLAELHHAAKGRPCPPDAKQIRKHAPNYQPLSLSAAHNISAIIERCDHFRMLVTALFAQPLPHEGEGA